jgi:hypothetical protein
MKLFGMELVNSKVLSDIKETVTAYKRTLEDIGWINLTTDSTSLDSIIKEGFKDMLKRVKIYYYNNPLAGHWVHLTTSFVFGEGVSIPKSKDEKIQEIIEKFWKDPDNRKTFTSPLAQHLLSNKLQYEGNLFFMLFDDEEGNVRVRVLNTIEVEDIINDPEDRNRELFYKVAYMKKEYDYVSDRWVTSFKQYKYYPDKDNYAYQEMGVPPEKLENIRIYHIKINCDINDKFGIPELYRGIDWMKAHKEAAQDVSTLVKALSKFAWKKKVKGSPAQVRSIAGNLQPTTDLSSLRNTAGQTKVENEGVTMEPIDIKTGGVSIGIDLIRQHKLMLCAASGLFEHYWGDPSTGNLATATTMEAPMVRKFTNYQTLWREVFNDILQYQIDMKISVGLLSGTDEFDSKMNRIKYIYGGDEDGRTIDIDFPPVLEAELEKVADALTKAKGGGIIGTELAAQLFMLAANVNNIDEEMEKLLQELEEKKKEEQEKFNMVQDAKGLALAAKGNKKIKESINSILEKVLDEAIETPNKNTGRTSGRITKKNNFLSQRMNSYRKKLTSNFRLFEKNIRDGIDIMATDEDQDGVKEYRGIINNLDKSVSTLIEGMSQSAREYFPQAVSIGEKYVKSEAKDAGLSGELREIKGKAPFTLNQKIEWNDLFLKDSLQDDLIAELIEASEQVFPSEEAYTLNIMSKVSKFENRIEMYAGAFWTVEEAAVKEAAKGLDMEAWYVGPDDELTCDGCRAAMENNPYKPEDVPVPGSFESGPRCRHAIQLKPKEK